MIEAYNEIKKLRALERIREYHIVLDSIKVLLDHVPNATREKVRRGLARALSTLDAGVPSSTTPVLCLGSCGREDYR